MNKHYLELHHAGLGHDDNPPGRGSGRYPYGSGERPFQDREPSKALGTMKNFVRGAARLALAASLSVVASNIITPILSPIVAPALSQLIAPLTQLLTPDAIKYTLTKSVGTQAVRGVIKSSVGNQLVVRQTAQAGQVGLNIVENIFDSIPRFAVDRKISAPPVSYNNKESSVGILNMLLGPDRPDTHPFRSNLRPVNIGDEFLNNLRGQNRLITRRR